MARALPETQKGESVKKDWLDNALVGYNRRRKILAVLIAIAAVFVVPFIILYEKMFPRHWDKMKKEYEKEKR